MNRSQLHVKPNEVLDDKRAIFGFDFLIRFQKMNFSKNILKISPNLLSANILNGMLSIFYNTSTFNLCLMNLIQRDK